MDPISIVGLVTAILPGATKLVKKLFKIDKIKDIAVRKSLNTLIPLVLGVISSGLFVYYRTGDIWFSLAIGLGSGGVASSTRDFGKYLGTLVGITKAYKKKKK